MKVIRPRFDEPAVKPPRTPRPPRRPIPARTLILWTMRGAALVAVVVSGYLAWLTFNPQSEIGCGAGFDCAAVFSSRWSKWLGLPVAIPAFSLYATLLIALAFSGTAAPPRVRQLAWNVAACLAIVAAGAGVWFIVIQSLVLESLCPWCLTVHVCGIGLAVLAAALGWKSLSATLTSVGVGLGLVGLLVAGQWLQGEPSNQLAYQNVVNKTSAPPVRLEVPTSDRPVAPPPTQIQANPEIPATSGTQGGIPNWSDDLATQPPNSANPPAQAESTDPLGQDLFDPPPPPLEGEVDLAPPQIEAAPPEQPAQPPQRIISLLDRQAEIDIYQHPILGSPEAKHVVVKLFDYTCHHCRVMHAHLQAARQQFGPDLAVVMLPVPMNSSCNQYVLRTDAKHLEACELSKLALAVWRADAASFEAFDAWLFAPDHPPTASQARAKAVELVGEAALARELGDWRLNDRLAIGVKLYHLAGQGAIPKVLVPPSGMIRGRVENRAEVLQFLQNVLGLKSASPTSTPSPIIEIQP